MSGQRPRRYGKTVVPEAWPLAAKEDWFFLHNLVFRVLTDKDVDSFEELEAQVPTRIGEVWGKTLHKYKDVVEKLRATHDLALATHLSEIRLSRKPGEGPGTYCFESYDFADDVSAALTAAVCKEHKLHQPQHPMAQIFVATNSDWENSDLRDFYCTSYFVDKNGNTHPTM